MTAKTEREITDRMRLALHVIERGNCIKTKADPDIFYPLDHGGRRPPGAEPVDIYAQARAICGGCDVRAECLQLADLYHSRHGMWGGLDPDEREARRRRLAQEADHG